MLLISWVGQAYFQYSNELSEAMRENHQLATKDYLNSFLSSTFENWQSEFLQLATMVILIAKFSHKGSPESKDSEAKTDKKLNLIVDLLRRK